MRAGSSPQGREPSGSSPDEAEARPPEAASPPAPRNPRDLVWAGLLALALFHTLVFARSLLVPVVVALLGNIALKPAVRWLARRRIPEPVSAAVLVVTVVGLSAVALSLVLDPASEWMRRLPNSVEELEWKLAPVRKPLETIGEAANRVEDAAKLGPSQPAVEVRGPSLATLVFDQTGGFLASLGLVIVLLFFLLASGENLLRKLVSELPTLREKRTIVEVVRATENDLARYFLTITCVNLALGVAVGCAMAALGMENPLLWGAMAATFNFVPYLGALVGVGVVALAALMTFDELSRVAAVPATYFLLTVLEGSFLTPYLLGQRMLLSPVAVLASLILWTWVWGVAGALVAVPILLATKVACGRVDALRPLAVLLGR